MIENPRADDRPKDFFLPLMSCGSLPFL